MTVLLGFVLDLLFGDPRLLHPVRLIGSTISIGEKFLLARVFSDRYRFYAGMFLSLSIMIVAYVIPYAILHLLGVDTLAGKLFNALSLGVLLSTRSLHKESMAVYHALRANDIAGARQSLSMIVGRDTQSLDSEAISRAAVETVAENSSDGVIAPLFFFAIGGAPACFLYKAVNTLDSMIGYKNEKYLHFGRFAARLDDVFNYIPAILTAWLSIIAAWLIKMDYKQAFRIYKRDKNQHPSPNSGKPEAAFAGALGLQLGGSSFYGGKKVDKATIGDNIKKADYTDIDKANALMIVTAVLGVVLILLANLAILLL